MTAVEELPCMEPDWNPAAQGFPFRLASLVGRVRSVTFWFEAAFTDPDFVRNQGLRVMATEEVETSSSSNAGVPLLFRNSHDRDAIGSTLGQNADVDCDRGQQHLQISEPKASRTWYIWALTFSSGISGLLFGYE